MPETAKLIGAAGSGKTSELLSIMDKVIASGVDPREIGFVSFTRAARREASSRAADKFGCKIDDLEQQGFFRTLHSICSKCLGTQRGEIITGNSDDRKWLEEVFQESIGEAKTDEDGELIADSGFSWDSPARVALWLWGTARQRMLPFDSVWRSAHAIDARVPELDKCTELLQRYEIAKQATGRRDFTDILSRFAGVKFNIDGPEDVYAFGDVPQLQVWIGDEMQDLSALLAKVMRRLTDSSKWLYLASDPFQCQPAGTMVRTRDGYKPIEEVCTKDGIVAFSVQEKRFYGASKKYKIKKASRLVDSSDIFEIETEDGDKLQATSNHKWPSKTLSTGWVGVYLMRRGVRWRVGTCQMRAGPGKTVGEDRLKMRAHQEAADSLWVLAVFQTDKEARCYEQVVSCKYGIPQVTFRPPWGKTYLDAWFIDKVFAGVGPLDEKAAICLKAHDKEIAFPYWTNSVWAQKDSVCYSRAMQTCNLIPGVSHIPKVVEKQKDFRTGRRRGIHRSREELQKPDNITWVKIKSVRRLSPGLQVPVYSLDVEKYHTYICNGYVTLNSIYGFSGADPRYFLEWPAAKTKQMPKSWRCAPDILAKGEQILSRCSNYWDRQVAPADHDGEVRRELLTNILMDLKPADDWLVLARTNMEAALMGKRLDKMFIPWRPTKGNNAWTAPIRNAVFKSLKDLQEGFPVDGEQWRCVLKYLPAEPWLVRGTKARFDEFSSEAAEKTLMEKFPWLQMNDLHEVGAMPVLVEAIRSGEWKNIIDEAKPWAKAVEKWGTEAVDNPRISVGTIHSAKGREAENVCLNTTITHQVKKSQETPEGFDEERRVEYVGATRAKKLLVIANDSQKWLRMDIP